MTTERSTIDVKIFRGIQCYCGTTLHVGMQDGQKTRPDTKQQQTNNLGTNLMVQTEQKFYLSAMAPKTMVVAFGGKMAKEPTPTDQTNKQY